MVCLSSTGTLAQMKRLSKDYVKVLGWADNLLGTGPKMHAELHLPRET